MSSSASHTGSTQSLRESELAGRFVGKYQVLLELGRGGMASVHLAVTHSAAGVSKLVVLKTLLPDVASQPDALAMFLDEARLAVQLNHGNVVQTYEVGQDGERHFIVMEYLEGQSLAALLRHAERNGQPLSLGLHLRVLMHVLEGLHYAHELRGYDNKPLQFVHRDVSPQNVFVTYDGRTKLLDFGIAKGATSTTHTTTGLIKGKIAYMSPEQMEGSAVDRRTDIYAVGCMLWAAATGKKLWKAVPDAHILRNVLTDGAPSPRLENPNCDTELERIVMRALATKRDERYGTALELQEDLERFCEASGFADRPRELGRLLAESFAATRADNRSRVERELSRVDASPADVEPDTGVSGRLGALPLEPQQLTASTATVAVSTMNVLPNAAAPRQRRWWAVPVALVVAGAGALYLIAQREQAERQAASTEQPVSPAIPSAAPAVTQATVRVELRSTPPTAKLFLDDAPLPANPALQVLPKDGAVHRVRAELAGHHSAALEFKASGDDAVNLTLDRLPEPRTAAHAKSAPHAAGKSARQATVHGAPPAAGKNTRATATAADCAQPFFLDAEGIKKIKPQCL